MLTELFIITCYWDGQPVWTTAGQTELQARASVPGEVLWSRASIAQWAFSAYSTQAGYGGWTRVGTKQWPM